MAVIRAEAWLSFNRLVATRGWAVVEPVYLGSKARHRVRCARRHVFTVVPNSLRKGTGSCRECPEAAGTIRQRFEAKVSDAGGLLLDAWSGTKRAYRVRCSAGHETAVRPANLLSREGMCSVCGKQERARQQLDGFRELVRALGGTLEEESWQGAASPHRCRCPRGHACTPRPASLKNGQGMCPTCSGGTPETAWQGFLERMAALGAEVLEDSWQGSEVPHRVRCRGGHLIRVWPSGAGKGRGICRICAGLDPAEAEKGFRAAVTGAGGTCLYPAWKGVNTPHLVRCPEGHLTSPRPNDVQQGHTLCRACAGKDPATAWRNFTALVADLGGTVLEGAWLGSQEPHLLECADGHVTRVRPAGVQQGQGICRFCAGHAWDAFYVVTDDAAGQVKFGITSGDPRPRLRTHAAAGFTRVLRVMSDLPGEDAPELERAVLKALRAEGRAPVRGREYFGLAELPTVLAVVDAYRAVRARP
ncbi:GIY-YIG nuclease family protein [Kitasatospora sp. NPDC056446]|uniref:GIY-YIG nuclease family protein n=1 Tax=Kitasatospora sp. NPDC056446 TaxID=3345819 RepID=UPI00368D4079